MKWGKLLGAAATVAGTVVGGPVGATVAVVAGSLTGGSVGKDAGKTQAKRVQNVSAPAGAAAAPALLTLVPGVDLTPVVGVMAQVMEMFFGCAVQCPTELTGVQTTAVAAGLGLLMSAFHQGAKNVQKSVLPQK